jgi:hypothetical protein
MRIQSLTGKPTRSVCLLLSLQVLGGTEPQNEISKRLTRPGSWFELFGGFTALVNRLAVRNPSL